MKRWEYQILMPFDGGNKKKWEDAINEAGKEGWRIVPNPCGFIYDKLLLLMEREIPETMAPVASAEDILGHSEVDPPEEDWPNVRKFGHNQGTPESPKPAKESVEPSEIPDGEAE